MKKLSQWVKNVMMATMSMIGAVHADQYGTGVYVGVDAGVILNHAELKSQQLGFTHPNETCDTSSDFSTFAPGMQIGYRHHYSNYFVVGIAADITVNTNQKESLSCHSDINPDVYDRFVFKNEMQTTLKGEIGRAFTWYNTTLITFFTTGASFASVGLTYNNEGGDFYATHPIQVGWLVGAGLDWVFKQNWSLRAEYHYIDYGNVVTLNIPSVYGLIDPNGQGRVKLNANHFFVALNYWI